MTGDASVSSCWFHRRRRSGRALPTGSGSASTINDRFLKPIEKILKGDEQSGEGFTIVAIDCILMEFLEALHQGRVYRYRESNRPGPPQEYSGSQELFVSFLSTRPRPRGLAS